VSAVAGHGGSKQCLLLAIHLRRQRLKQAISRGVGKLVPRGDLLDQLNGAVKLLFADEVADDALRDKLGFEVDFIYEAFYASVSRDGFAIHLKDGPKLPAEREHRKQNEHLDAYISVAGVRDLFEEIQARGVQVIRPLEQRPWACVDFYVEDPDGYLLCFSEPNA